MKSFATLFSLLFTIGLSGQDVTEEICTQYEAGKYKVITSTYGDQVSTLPYKALFHVGLAYYKLGKDKLAIEIMDRCIAQDKKDSGPLYIKGKSLNFMRQFGKAASAFQKAIDVDGGNGSYYAGLGDAYMSMNQLDKALQAYTDATRSDDCPQRAYLKIPLILSAMGKTAPALEAYHTAKDQVDRDSEGYLNILYNIGLHEAMNGDFFEAKKVLTELLETDPSFYRAYPILIQSNIVLRKFDEIPALREQLYTAHEKGLLKYSLRDRFCFDQFVWEDNLVVKAYERFESGNDTEYFKHVYEIQKDDIPSYSIQTRHLPKKSKPYILQKNVGDLSYTYAATFDRKFKYEELKAEVINIMTEKATPIEK